MTFKKLEPKPRYSFNGFRYSGQSINFSRKGFPFVYNYDYAFVEADTVDKVFRITFLQEDEKGAFTIRFPGAGPVISCKIPDMPKGRYIQSSEDQSVFILSK